MTTSMKLRDRLIEGILIAFGGDEYKAKNAVDQVLSEFSGASVYIPKSFGPLCSGAQSPASDTAKE
jgi:hypothetical protein